MTTLSPGGMIINIICVSLQLSPCSFEYIFISQRELRNKMIISVRTKPLNLSDRLFLTGGKLGLKQNMDDTRMKRLVSSCSYYYFISLLDVWVRINNLSSFVSFSPHEIIKTLTSMLLKQQQRLLPPPLLMIIVIIKVGNGHLLYVVCRRNEPL